MGHGSRAMLAALFLLGGMIGGAIAQQGGKPSWVIDELVPLARAEGQLTVYSATNEQEALPLWKMFQDVNSCGNGQVWIISFVTLYYAVFICGRSLNKHM